jgi:predicted phosphohydrolase
VNFINAFAADGADALLITGDIGQSLTFAPWLEMLSGKAKVPVYYVLGNHDYYQNRGTFPVMTTTRKVAKSLSDGRKLFYLPNFGPAKLGEHVCIVGADGWYDGRYADPLESNVVLSDFELINGFRGKGMAGIIKKARALADESAGIVSRQIEEAVQQEYKTIVVAMHVPPFPECSTYNGVQSDSNWLPWMSSQAMGDVLSEMAEKYKNIFFWVLCGHSHGNSNVVVRKNMRVITGVARYGRPMIQPELEITAR